MVLGVNSIFYLLVFVVISSCTISRVENERLEGRYSQIEKKVEIDGKDSQ